MEHEARRTRRTALQAGAAVCVVVAAACGTAETTSPVPKAERQPVTLRLNYRTEQWIVDRAKQFTEANPSISVDPVANSGYEKLLVLAAAGDLGDV
jgi:ABC-type glycerol-3-phosphate transport system substrate-binding protein